MGRGGTQIASADGLGLARSGDLFRATLYRAGEMRSPEHYGVAHDSYAAADAVRPEGRPGRLDGLFCSHGMQGLVRWFRANKSGRIPYQPTKISYLGPEPYAYPIEVWEVASSRDGGDDAYRAYWACGVPLSVALADPERYDDREWEVLIDPAYVRSAGPVAVRRLIEIAEDPYEARELMREHFPGLYRKGIVYGTAEREQAWSAKTRRNNGLAHELAQDVFFRRFQLPSNDA